MNNNIDKSKVAAALDRDAKDLKSKALVNSLSSSLSTIELMRDYIDMVQLKYKNNHDPNNLHELMTILFSRNGLEHLDLALSDVKESLDLVLTEIFDDTDK